MWIAAGLGFLVVLLGIVLSLIPPGETANKLLFEVELISGTAIAILIGLALYYRGVQEKSREAKAPSSAGA